MGNIEARPNSPRKKELQCYSLPLKIRINLAINESRQAASVCSIVFLKLILAVVSLVTTSRL
jgi:hypothetical protein